MLLFAQLYKTVCEKLKSNANKFMQIHISSLFEISSSYVVDT